jgi:hypothetical protein
MELGFLEYVGHIYWPFYSFPRLMLLLLLFTARLFH